MNPSAIANKRAAFDVPALASGSGEHRLLGLPEYTHTDASRFCRRKAAMNDRQSQAVSRYFGRLSNLIKPEAED